jgi:hypothetical protein
MTVVAINFLMHFCVFLLQWLLHSISVSYMVSISKDYLLQQLHSLTEEHFALDQLIGDTEHTTNLDQIMLQRLKKRKLLLKDSIREIRSRLHPEIIA